MSVVDALEISGDKDENSVSPFLFFSTVIFYCINCLYIIWFSLELPSQWWDVKHLIYSIVLPDRRQKAIVAFILATEIDVQATSRISHYEDRYKISSRP